MAHNIQVRELIRSVAEWKEGSEQREPPREQHAAACRTSRTPVKNPRAACRGMLILCRGMSLGACRGMAITGFLESSFFLVSCIV